MRPVIEGDYQKICKEAINIWISEPSGNGGVVERCWE
jgi:hypothetical protein